MAIAFKEGPGSLWRSDVVRLSPRFEIRMKIKINAHGCYDAASSSIDGFAFILTKTKQTKIGTGGNAKGYGGIYDALITEIDLLGNPGEISSNFVKLNKCYGKICEPTNLNSISKSLSFNYNKCSKMTYDVKMKYSEKRLNIYVNGQLYLSSPEDLEKKFNGFAYFGMSGTFKGHQRELVVSNDSYICTDEIKSITIYSIVDGVRTNGNLPDTIRAGVEINVFVQLIDVDGQLVPHLKLTDLHNLYKLNIQINCYDSRQSSSYSPFIDKTTMLIKVNFLNFFLTYFN